MPRVGWVPKTGADMVTPPGQQVTIAYHFTVKAEACTVSDCVSPAEHTPRWGDGCPKNVETDDDKSSLNSD